MKISVVVPVYNDYGWLIHLLLPSIQVQTLGLKDIEVVVVDDGSTELIPDDLLKRFKFVKFYKQDHKGGSVARNLGLQHVTGEYVIFPDTDCLLFPDCLEVMLKTLVSQPKYTFVYSHFLMVEKEGWINYFSSYKFNKELLEKINYISACSLVRKGSNLVWDETLKRFQDWELWLRLVRQGRIGTLIEQPLYFHFLRSESITSTITNYEESKKIMFEVLDKKV